MKKTTNPNKQNPPQQNTDLPLQKAEQQTPKNNGGKEKDIFWVKTVLKYLWSSI